METLIFGAQRAFGVDAQEPIVGFSPLARATGANFCMPGALLYKLIAEIRCRIDPAIRRYEP